MLDAISHVLMVVGAVIVLGGVALLWVLGLFAINEETKHLFKDHQESRKANKFFKKIEEFRNDFA